MKRRIRIPLRDENVNISVTKVQNGFIVNVSKDEPDEYPGDDYVNPSSEFINRISDPEYLIKLFKAVNDIKNGKEPEPFSKPQPAPEPANIEFTPLTASIPHEGITGISGTYVFSSFIAVSEFMEELLTK